MLRDVMGYADHSSNFRVLKMQWCIGHRDVPRLGCLWIFLLIDDGLSAERSTKPGDAALIFAFIHGVPQQPTEIPRSVLTSPALESAVHVAIPQVGIPNRDD